MTAIGTCPLDGITTVTTANVSGFSGQPVNGMVDGTCGHKVYAQTVRGRVGVRECGAWCWDGVGRSCVCQCGGKNHGTSYAHLGATGSDR
jgi:hypothetical protein